MSGTYTNLMCIISLEPSLTQKEPTAFSLNFEQTQFSEIYNITNYPLLTNSSAKAKLTLLVISTHRRTDHNQFSHETFIVLGLTNFSLQRAGLCPSLGSGVNGNRVKKSECVCAHSIINPTGKVYLFNEFLKYKKEKLWHSMKKFQIAK